MRRHSKLAIESLERRDVYSVTPGIPSVGMPEVEPQGVEASLWTFEEYDAQSISLGPGFDLFETAPPNMAGHSNLMEVQTQAIQVATDIAIESFFGDDAGLARGTSKIAGDFNRDGFWGTLDDYESSLADRDMSRSIVQPGFDLWVTDPGAVNFATTSRTRAE